MARPVDSRAIEGFLDAGARRLCGVLVDDWLDRHTRPDPEGLTFIATGNMVRQLRWTLPGGRVSVYERLTPGGDFHLRPA
jgi:hypothetical protein